MVFLLLCLGFYGVCAAGLLYLRYFDPLWTSVQLQRRFEAYWESRPYKERYKFLGLQEIPDHLEHAVLAAEDSRFFQHRGIDWIEIEKIVTESLERGYLWRGGSTITQQLVKNLFLTTHRSILRKLVELPLTWVAEFLLPKERILELYLNVIEWGPGIYGVEAASRYHYGRPAARIGREQSARLAACIPDPLRRKPQQMDAYSRLILGRMKRMGW